MSYTYRWPRPALTVDIALVAKRTASAATRILLIRRKNPPYKDHWALPGGFVDENEPLEKAALRELQEETSVDPKLAELVQIGTYGNPGRDPRGWTVTVLYASVVESSGLRVKAADDAAEASWIDITQLPRLAFDHKLLVKDTFNRLLSFLPEGQSQNPDVFPNENLGSTCEDLRASLQSNGLK